MKVFQINTVYNTGSTGHIVAQLKHAVEETGGECLAAFGRGSSLEKNTYKIGSEPDKYFHALMTRFTDRTGFYSNGRTKKLIHELISFCPDIIHLHNLHGYYLNIEILFDFLKEFHKPVIWTLHDSWSYTGHCASYEAVHCEKWKTHCMHCPKQKEYPASRFTDNSQVNYERKKKVFSGVEHMRIVTPSHWLAAEVKQSFLKDYCVQVIPNGIDTDIFKPVKGNAREKWQLGEKDIILGVASRWTDRKGLHDFNRLASMLDHRYVIVLVGLSHRQLENLPENIVGIERTENMQELAQLYSEALVFVNLTYEDNFPSVNLEALACGTPVITYRAGGSPEAINEKTGICVEVGDIEAVADSIEKIRGISREDCRMRGMTFEKTVRFHKYLELYELTLCENGGQAV